MNPTLTNSKTVHLVSSRPRRDVQVQISPVDTASDVLSRAGLEPNDHYIIKPNDQAEIGMDETVFPHVSDGGKLNVVPQSDVGGAGIRPLPTYAQDHGWIPRRTIDGITHEGYYRANGLRWEGRVKESRWGELQFEINNPPLTYIRQSPWAGCFHAMTGTWMWITFLRQPTDISSGVAAVNKILKSVFANRQQYGRY